MPQLGHLSLTFSTSLTVLPKSDRPANKSARPNCCSICTLFSRAQSSHRCISVICSSTISVKCTVAFFSHKSHFIFYRLLAPPWSATRYILHHLCVLPHERAAIIFGSPAPVYRCRWCGRPP